jgi:hypothetical protein
MVILQSVSFKACKAVQIGGTNKKTAIAGGFLRNSVWALLSCCFYVNLPLFHRLGAGIAKVKIKVKAREIHVFSWF